MPTGLPNERAIRESGSMQLDPSGEGVAIDETRRLIASNKVEGTLVYNRAGEELGTVYNFMVDCAPSAPVRQVGAIHEGRISGSS